MIGQYIADKEKNIRIFRTTTPFQKAHSLQLFRAVCCTSTTRVGKEFPSYLKAGKALSERKSEVRIQFRRPAVSIFPHLQPNELVIKVQPGEAVFLKMTTKKPGLTEETVYTELDLSYASRFKVSSLPDAYERLILEVIRGDHNLFVRSDELLEAWKIFTPILKQFESEKAVPIPYEFGTRGPRESDELIARYGYERPEGYSWSPAESGKK